MSLLVGRGQPRRLSIDERRQYKGTREINSLIVGLAITGESAFAGPLRSRLPAAGNHQRGSVPESETPGNAVTFCHRQAHAVECCGFEVPR
jgi:hypothetical protein